MHETYHQPVKADLDPERQKAATNVTLVGAGVNLVLALVKFVAGVLGHSAAMVADAIHSLSDLVTDGVVLVSVKISSQGADENHPYGHGRAETIGAAIVGASLGVVGLFMVIDIMHRVINDTLSAPTMIAVWGALISIVTKEILYQYTVRIGEKHDMPSIIANAWHHRSDALSSVAALVGVIGSMMGFSFMDPLAALVVVGMIVKVGYEIAKEAVDQLMEATAPPEKLSDIRKEIMKADGVRRFHELRSRMVGADLFIDVHIIVQPNISVSEAHNIAETVRENLKKHTKATDALVHIDAEDDIYYKVMRFDREKIEQKVSGEVENVEGLYGVSEFIIHMLNGQLCVDFTVDVDENLSVGEAKKRVEKLRQTLTGGGEINTAVIRGRLTESVLETDFVKGANDLDDHS